MAARPQIPGIETSPDVLGGKPPISGTRIGVDLILEKIGGGETIDKILRDYPRLTRGASRSSRPSIPSAIGH